MSSGVKSATSTLRIATMAEILGAKSQQIGSDYYVRAQMAAAIWDRTLDERARFVVRLRKPDLGGIW